MSEKVIQVGFVSSFDPTDRKASSGTNYQVFQALSRQPGLHVFWIPFKEPSIADFVYRLYWRINRLFPYSMPIQCSLFLNRLSVWGVDRKQMARADVLFSSYARLYMAPKPVVYHSDALFHEMVGYYWMIPAASRWARIGNRLQRKVLDNAVRLVFPSQWAARDAVDFYHQPAAKVSVVKYGPNIDVQDIAPHTFRYEGHLHVLFLGVDWARKGGQLAVDTVEWLNAHGVPSTLHVVGIRQLPEGVACRSCVDFVGFLDKNNPEEYRRLSDVIAQCHCMLLPTQAECAGIAFCESSAYGLPSFTHRTGGIPDYVVDGVNGYTLPLGSTSADFGAKIKSSLESGEMEQMSVTAIEYQRRELNYDVFGQEIAKIIRSIYNKV